MTAVEPPLSRRGRLKLACATGLLVCVAAPALAAEMAYPVKPIRWIVPFPPSGITDIVARLVGQKMTEAWGQNVLVDNRPGAGGVIGTDLIAKANPDGYTIGGTPLNFLLYPTLYRKVPFNVPRDFLPISLVASIPSILMVHPSVAAHSVRELIALARNKPGVLSYASGGGVGSGSHVAAELFKRLAGVDIVHVPYKGGAAAAIAIASGEVQVLFGTSASIMPTVKAGRVRPLAVTSAKRLNVLPDLPTIAEAGVPGFETEEMQGVVAPAGTPPQIIRKLNTEIVRILKLPDVNGKLTEIGAAPVATSPEAFAAYIDREIKKWADLFRGSNVAVDF